MHLRLPTITPRARRVLAHSWRVAGVRWQEMAVPVALMLLAGAGEALSYGLLLPLTDAVAQDGFGSLGESRFFGWIPSLLPAEVREGPSAGAWLTLLMLGLLLAGRVLKLGMGYARSVYIHTRNERYRIRVATDTFRRVLGFGRQYFDRHSLGSIDREIGWSSSPLHILGAAEDLLWAGFGLVVKAGVMLAVSWPLTVALFLIYPLLHLVLARTNAAVRSATREALEVERKIGTEVLDLLGSMPLVKAHSQEAAAAARHEEVLEAARGHSLKRWRIVSLRWPLSEALLLVAVMATEGVLILLAGDFRPGDLGRFAAFLLLLQQAFPDLGKVLSFGLSLAEQLPSLDALAELHDDEGKYTVESGARAFTGVQRGIELCGLTFRYRDDVEVLRGIDATIPAGRVTAIVGESGSGKTTLLGVLARLLECPPGTVLVDGVDIRSFSVESLHRRMAVVSQDVGMLNRSLRDNLAFGLERVPPDAELVEVVSAMGLGDFLAALPEGLATEVGDRGVRLSRGQRQRIAVARAVLRDADVLILDEATSALDSVSERKVEATLEERARGRTMVVVAHRLSTIRSADRIVVMEEGRVVEQGGWHELLALEGAFARLHRAQFGALEGPDAGDGPVGYATPGSGGLEQAGWGES